MGIVLGVIVSGVLLGLFVVGSSRILQRRISALATEDWSPEGQKKELARMRMFLPALIFMAVVLGFAAGGTLGAFSQGSHQVPKEQFPDPPDWEWLED